TGGAEYQMAWPLRIPKTCAQKSSITRRLIQRERSAVTDNLRQISCALVLAAILGSCTGADIENAALGQRTAGAGCTLLSTARYRTRGCLCNKSGQSSDTSATRAAL